MVNFTAPIRDLIVSGETSALVAVCVTRLTICLADTCPKMDEKMTEPTAPPRDLKVPINPIATPKSRCGT